MREVCSRARAGRGLLCVAASVWLGCGDSATSAPLLGDCTTAACTVSPGGGGGSQVVAVPDGGGIRDAATPSDVVDLHLTIAELVDASFFQSAPFTGPVLVSAFARDGQLESAADAAVVGSGLLAGVPAGLDWFGIEPASGASAMTPTLEPSMFTTLDPTVILHVVSTEALGLIRVDGPSWSPDPDRASVVLVFLRDGRPRAGVTMVGPVGIDVIYDVGQPFYTALTDTTGAAGVVIVRDIEGAGIYPALTPMTLQYRVATTTLPLQLFLARGFVTWVEVGVSE